jgi:hypothetical protein
MTAQFPDTVAYKNTAYLIAGISGTELFTPSAYGLEPVGKSSACWRGFICEYKVAGEQLFLDRLSLYLNQAPPAALFGTASNLDKNPFEFDAIYNHLEHPMDFTGGLLLATDFIRELYVHMGFHPAWKYKVVHELIFENGELKQEKDCSEKVARIREEMSKRPLQPGSRANEQEVERWIDQCFSQKYQW